MGAESEKSTTISSPSIATSATISTSRLSIPSESERLGIGDLDGPRLREFFSDPGRADLV